MLVTRMLIAWRGAGRWLYFSRAKRHGRLKYPSDRALREFTTEKLESLPPAVASTLVGRHGADYSDIIMIALPGHFTPINAVDNSMGIARL